MTSPRYDALVVDDDPLARRIVGYALSQENFFCTYATDGADALSRVLDAHFDLVVTDLRMPNTHGYALVLKLLSRDHCPVIIVHSGIDEPRLTKDLIIKGVDDVVAKPANYAAFAAKARALVTRRRSATGLRARFGPLRVVGPGPSDPPTSGETFGGFAESGMASPGQPEGVRQAGPPPDQAAQQRRAKILELARQTETTPQDLAAAVRQDTRLSQEVLHLANSSGHQFGSPPTRDLREAVIRLGFGKIVELVSELTPDLAWPPAQSH